MEHWAHRLYPKLPFEDVTDRIAELGKKKAVSNYVKRVRVGMEVYAEHIQDPKDQDREEEEEEVDNVARMGDPEDREKENDALFDSIVDRYQSAKASETGGDGTGDKAADAFPEDDEDEELFSQAIAQSQY